MKLYHATPASNLESIKTNGLLVSKAKKSNQFVWLHTSSRSAWAVLHTCKNHKADWDEVIILEVEVPRSWIKAHKLTIQGQGLRGFWKCNRNISSDRIIKSTNAAQYATSVA